MERIARMNVFPQDRSRRRIIIGALLSLCVICVSASALWVYTTQHTKNTVPVTQAAPSIPYTGHRSDEASMYTSRSVSMAESSAHTTELPWAIALDESHGYAWAAEPGCEPLPACPKAFPGIIGQYAFSDGTFIQDFTEPNGYTGPLFIVVDSAGHLWFTQPTSDAIGELDPVNKVWHQWSVKKNSQPYGMTIDAHNNLWFTEFGGNQIGFFNTATHTLVETPVPTPQSSPYGITIDSNGTVWFAENRILVSQVGSFTTTTNGKIKIVEHAVGAASRPHLITTDKAGNVWFTNGFASSIGEYNPTTGTNRQFFVYPSSCLVAVGCTTTHISGIRADDKGNIWFSDSLGQRVGYLVPATGQYIERAVPLNSHPHDGLILDNSGRVWFTEQDAFTLNVWPMANVK